MRLLCKLVISLLPFPLVGLVHLCLKAPPGPVSSIVISCLAFLAWRLLIGHAHLDYYLDEFTFRFNRRTSASRGKLFYRLLQQAVQVDPTPYKNIVGGKPDHNL